MNKILCYLSIILVFIACRNSQTGSFRKIEYAAFDYNSPRTEKKDSVYILTYCTLSGNGLMEISDRDDLNKKNNYYSFQLTNAEIKKFDSVFNEKQVLKSYLAKTKMEDSTYYAGSYDYFRVTYLDGTVDSVCIIALFMTEHFKNVYDSLGTILYDREDRKEIKQFEIPGLFKNSLKSCYLKSTYLPEIIQPPPFKSE